ncbi:MAG: hypothetical protein SOW25_02065 [Helicobacter sp.]|nr:hypothetical protein [Helicobacteraceae bacterium]MDY3113095.1 hypothetical protein [Helicobacter sp.]
MKYEYFLKQITNKYSVIADSCESLESTLKNLKNHKRVESLSIVKIPLKTLLDEISKLMLISSYGCKIYCFFEEEKIEKEFKNYEKLAKVALIFIKRKDSLES